MMLCACMDERFWFQQLPTPVLDPFAWRVSSSSSGGGSLDFDQVPLMVRGRDGDPTTQGGGFTSRAATWPGRGVEQQQQQ